MNKNNYFDAGECDVAVVGAGHAGCEAALACARMGFKTIIFAINLDSVGNMPCNPSIGGTSKGQLVREIDALGGSMGKIADKTTLQSKILNKAKGPAVYSLRAQIDRRRYQEEMKHELELQKNLEVKQGEIIDILTEDGETIPHVTGVVTHTGATYKCKSVILCTGTYLKGRVIIGDVSYSSGPDGLFPANSLSPRLKELGFSLIRFKTGTPARIRREGIDFSQMEIQYGDDVIEPFSAETDKVEIDQMPCYLTHTTAETHEIIRKNIHRSPMFNGSIEGVGPRYCPSIEDKVMRFADKERHQAFVEPMGRNTEEMYLQGMSSSLPEDVQIQFIRSIKGLSDVVIMRPAYAIEYDAIDAQQLKLSLESRIVDNLFFAGQINGSSGYEEAAAQGIVAGINAALKLQGREPMIIDRSEGYTGVLIDDLVTMGTNEPYRMMTSRAEYRLILRHDNAEERLLEKGYKVGLISEERYQKFLKKQENIKNERERLESTYISHPKMINGYLEEKGSTPLKSSASLADLLRRPELMYSDIKEIEKLAGIDNPCEVSKEVGDELEILVKYEGYIKRQEQQINQFRKMEKKILPEDFDYKQINTLSLEAREKLNKIKPASIGQASRISGVSPADITALLVYFKEV
ncbi:MAG: tRNA uridine-5-carboxymethylaminomethyl(34) synthesis enzyme MnmG [Clostridia bacterium]|nr:tRNA uridine-5-carboxymethylaminomethyl(34) synthesis enzyme MnmG [Clostridia bacterium]